MGRGTKQKRYKGKSPPKCSTFLLPSPLYIHALFVLGSQELPKINRPLAHAVHDLSHIPLTNHHLSWHALALAAISFSSNNVRLIQVVAVTVPYLNGQKVSRKGVGKLRGELHSHLTIASYITHHSIKYVIHRNHLQPRGKGLLYAFLRHRQI